MSLMHDANHALCLLAVGLSLLCWPPPTAPFCCILLTLLALHTFFFCTMVSTLRCTRLSCWQHRGLLAMPVSKFVV